ncbi:uncharacterized protein LOC106140231 [Amyelois transitella]|uniref:uncharacterized protein LOC106140231 n=1 Tax=Amyelois transitella TaxID=680683 RepID=UPI00067B7282|nr:uncharacterized protein LOC106140231 [Amyelois transitella]
MADDVLVDTNDNGEVDEETVNDSSALIPTVVQSDNNKLKIINGVLNLLAHLMIGATVGTAITFCLREGEMNTTKIHIILCVLGYQLLIAESILSLSPDNSWSSSLKFTQKRQAHWILQIVGSGFAITGSFIKILNQSSHWKTLHAKFALVALVFTIASLVNGVTSLFANELRRIIPGSLSKITHIIFGTIAFGAASISLCYGFNKGSFRKWTTPEVAATVIVLTASLTLIIIVNPLITFSNKTVRSLRRRRFM